MTTTSSRQEALKISQALVESRLAGCVQITGPLFSTYRWKGVLEQGQEWQCLIKTRLDLYGPLEREIRRLHSYETPEIIALPIATGSADYLKWLEGELRAKEESPEEK